MLTRFKFEMKNIIKVNILMMVIVTALLLTACQSELSQKEELAEINTKDSLDMQVDFSMKIEDIFSIQDVGVAVTGVPTEGSVAEGKSYTEI